jgi:hypothetical protein
LKSGKRRPSDRSGSVGSGAVAQRPMGSGTLTNPARIAARIGEIHRIDAEREREREGERGQRRNRGYFLELEIMPRSLAVLMEPNRGLSTQLSTSVEKVPTLAPAPLPPSLPLTFALPRFLDIQLVLVPLPAARCFRCRVSEYEALSGMELLSADGEIAGGGIIVSESRRHDRSVDRRRAVRH